MSVDKVEDGIPGVDASLLDARRRRSSVAPHLHHSRDHGACMRALRGPCRIARLCILGLFTPALLVSLPLYMRYHVLHEQQYPVALSDVRLLDSRVSTTWCQKQVVSGNASFNAYLVPETPQYNNQRSHVGMTRHLVLEDDMKEYWAFYLLPGSKVHISACSRWPGASLIVIRGHKHLRDCAYIGDDSSEEEDELAQIEREREEDEAARASLRHHVSINGSLHLELPEESTRRPRLGRPKPLLGKSFDDTVKFEQQGTTTPEPDLEMTSAETKVTGITSAEVKVTGPTSEEALEELWSRVTELGPSGRRALRRLAVRLENADPGDRSSEESSEVMLLRRLVQQLLASRHHGKSAKKPVVSKQRASRHLDTANLEEQEAWLRAQLETEVRRRLSRSQRRVQRAASQLASELSGEPGPEEDVALEEGLSPDGIADDRGRFVENTTNDRSNDEFWSSFSSSEEALMNCEGLILYLPLTARPTCNHPASASITPTDTFSYTAPASGYYFFVFSSENEIQENLISVSFSLERTVYNVSQRVAQCDNSTSCAFPLDFFSSEKVVLEVPVAPGKEGPSPGDSADTLSRHWNEEYLIISTCEPRTTLYLVCVILVPILILTFAFS